MNWIRLSCDYFRHRKTLRLTRKLGDVAALYPLKLWLWAVEQSESGSLSDLDAEELAALVGYAGKPADLWKAMESCGFIENDPDDGWRIRSWGEHQLAMIEQAEAKREKDRARWRRWRARQLAGALAPTADEAANVGERGATLPSPARTDGTNGTERTNGGNGSAPPALLPDLPAALDTDRFRAAWDAWLAYRREAKLKKWSERTVKMQLRDLAAAGESVAVEAIRKSILNGWQGLFPHPDNGNGSRPIGATATLKTPRAQIIDLRILAEGAGATADEAEAIDASTTVKDAQKLYDQVEARIVAEAKQARRA